MPSPNTDFVAVAAGWQHSLGLKSDGTVIAWGRNEYGQCNVPSPNADFVAVAAGRQHSLALKSDGTVVAWGDNRYYQCNVPSPNADFVSVAAGGYHSLRLRGLPSVAVTLSDAQVTAGRGYVELRWSLVVDVQARLLVLRSTTEDGKYEPVRRMLEGRPCRSNFSYRDTTAWPSSEFYYKIGCLESGSSIWTYSALVHAVTPDGVFGFLGVRPNPGRGGAQRLQFELDRSASARL